MILASGEGQLIFLVIMAFIGVINWIAGKMNAGGKNGPATPPVGSGDAPRRANAESEEERMRRFLEALGLPSDARPSPAPPRIEPRPAPPIPTIARREIRPTVTPPPLQPQPRATSRPERRQAVTKAETIKLPDLAVPSVPEFETISSRIAAMPQEFPALRDDPERLPVASIGETLRAALASPQQLRSAFILSEVFGTPPGLR